MAVCLVVLNAWLLLPPNAFGQTIPGFVNNVGTALNPIYQVDPGVYVVTGTITVPDHGTLRILPGATLRFQPLTGVIVNGGGVLNAVGQDVAPPGDPASGLVVFTSDSDTKAAGQWGRIWLQGGSTATLDRCVVEYGGQNNTGEQMIRVDSGAALTMLDSRVQYAARAGLAVFGNLPGQAADVNIERTVFRFLQNAPVLAGEAAVQVGESTGVHYPLKFTLKDSSILDSGPTGGVWYPGLQITCSAPSDTTTPPIPAQNPALVVIEHNTFGNNSTGIVFHAFFQGAAATVGHNTFLAHSGEAIRGSWNSILRSTFGVPEPDDISGVGAGFHGIVVAAASLSPPSDLTLGLDGDAGYRVDLDMSLVESGKILHIAKGVRIAVEPGHWLSVQGTLDVKGESGAEVVLTRATVSPGTGDYWGKLSFGSGSTGRLSHLVAEYGGNVDGACVEVNRGADLELHGCTVRYSSNDGLAVRGGNGSGILRLVADGDGYFTQNAKAGVRVGGAVAPSDAQLSGQTFEANVAGVDLIDPTSSVQLSGNKFKNHGVAAIRGPVNPIAHSLFGHPTADDFSLMTSGHPGILITGGNATSAGGLLAQDGAAPNRISADISVNAGVTLAIAPGCTLHSVVITKSFPV